MTDNEIIFQKNGRKEEKGTKQKTGKLKTSSKMIELAIINIKCK